MLTLSIIIMTLLVIATAFIEWKIIQKPIAEHLNNRKRIHSWWIILAICLPIFYIGGHAITLFSLLLSLWAFYEFSRLINVKYQLRHIFVIDALVFFYALVVYLFTLPQALILFLLCLPLVSIAFALYCIKWHKSGGVCFDKLSRTAPFIRLSKTAFFDKLLPLLLILFGTTALSSLIIIVALANHARIDSGLLLFYLFALAAINDILQYISGKLFGKTPLASTLSPNKTREGAIGGILLTGLLGMIALPFIIPNTTWQSAWLISSVLSIAGIAGDLTVSYFKRRAGVKNTGHSIPGHGGLLDRIDSLLFIAPVFGICLFMLR